jgi:aspartyl-tRNA(Asn)/glutamyl-tRNA(Gln) amidotransferase subunit A
MSAQGPRSALELRDGVRDGRWSCVEALTGVLEQVRRANGRLEALNEIYADEALAAARALDRRRAAGEELGPLAGVPFTAKDNIATLTGQTTAASKILQGYRAPYQATAVSRLTAAGAILLGKTNMDEFGMGSSTENSSVRVTRNPWRTSHVPGGSSGGAAALAASVRGMLHLGSDTGGSIRQPAACCGVTGFKPTYGRVSRYGLLAFASSLDQIGPLAQSARDCALALGSMAGADPLDSTAARLPVPDMLSELARGVSGLRLGVVREYFPEGVDPEVKERVLEAVEAFRGLGVRVEEVSLPHARYANPTYVLVSAAEASSNLARYDGVHYGYRAGDAENLLDLYSRSRVEGFGPEVKRRIMVGTFVLSSGYYDAFYLKALKVRRLIRRDFEKAFERVDAVIGPTSPVTAFPIGDRMDDPLKLYAVDVLTVSANLASVPGISFPCGFTGDRLPVGAQILARPFEDTVALRFAHGFQEATAHHRAEPAVCGWKEDCGG